MITKDIRDILFRVECQPVYTKGGLFAGNCIINYEENKVTRLVLTEPSFISNKQLLADTKELYPTVKWRWAYHSHAKDIFHIIGELPEQEAYGHAFGLEIINSYNGKTLPHINFCLRNTSTNTHIFTNISATEGVHVLINVINQLRKDNVMAMTVEQAYENLRGDIPAYIARIIPNIGQGRDFHNALETFSFYSEFVYIWSKKSFELSRNFIAQELELFLKLSNIKI